MRFSLADTQQAEDVAAFIAAAQGPYAGVILNVSIKYRARAFSRCIDEVHARHFHATDNPLYSSDCSVHSSSPVVSSRREAIGEPSEGVS
jgi:hypothetical protein